MSVAEKHRAFLETFSHIPDRQDRLAAIVDRARRASAFPLDQKTPANRVHGCASAVWVTCQDEGETLRFAGDAEGPIVKGLVRLLTDLYDGGTAAEIVATEPTLLEELDVLRDLSPTRRNGLIAVRTRIRELAAKRLNERPAS